ncbi:MAG: type 4a pilus biogenesis protein PilO [Candidatus Omnitrophota bacterium]|nr:type 4a pilus biogenesis protein PilO [Candidatus Omnitrophota bacterium]
MAQIPKSFNFNKEQFLTFLPLIICFFVIILFLLFLIPSQMKKVSTLSAQLTDKKNSLTLVERGSKSLSEAKKEIIEMGKRIVQLEKKLPKQIETTLLIDTLKDITEEARLKFSSIEPLAQRNFELKGQDEFYVELPIAVKLKCTFFDLIDFIHKIENSARLMKISKFTIRDNPQDVWEHNVELSISTFATSHY